ncbi:MAG: ABC transporter ATP-binding protein, partial [Candidatus Omnitrophica bacterium]|nr:ABC transporter ATP-binding protein [Candidatus Omnitrophota bacterium]
VSFFKPLFYAFHPSGNIAAFTLIAAVIMVTVIVKSFWVYLSGLQFAYYNEHFSFHLRNKIFDRYLSFGRHYFDRNSKGYVTTVLKFSDQFQNVISYLSGLLKKGFTLIVYLVMMTLISWPLTLFFMVTFPVLIILTYGIVESIRRVARNETRASLKQGKEVFNLVHGISVIQAYTRESFARERFRSITSRLRKAGFLIGLRKKLIDPIQEMIMVFSLIVLASVITFVYVHDRSSEIAGFLLFLILARRSFPLFAAFNDAKAVIARKEHRLKEVMKIFEEGDFYDVPQGSRRCGPIEQGIVFRKVNFAYVPDMPVLNDLDLEIEKGKVTALVGPTGAGKTTIANLILRFYDCRPGTILIDGEDIRQFTLESIRERIAFVGQDVLLFNDTIRNNLLFAKGREVQDKEIEEALKKARLYDFVMRLPRKWDTEIGDVGVCLAGGERQRLSIARAILKDAEVMILDEATSSLDTITERLIQEAIEESIQGRTTIVIAHRLSTIKHADKVVVIQEGRKMEEGSLSELIEARGVFNRYWEEQKFFV